MENPQMGMPAEMAAQGPNPEEMAIFDQMRQEISPQEFSNEMLAGASQVDPQAVTEFTQELQGLDMPPEVLDALNDVVDEILANPERYDELRAQYMDQGLPEDILPEQFDPNFFAALNMAIDQMIAAPAGVQAFAQGGIAELKPIAKAIADYGRNGDTMLAHITPAEARMLRRRGGSGTINPDTGLPEFFLKGLFKGIGKALSSIGKAVKKFASSTVGRIVTTVALGFFLGPAAASMMGVSSVAGVAAVSGFVGGAGSTLLAGGNIKDALKAGAIGGLTAGAGAGVMGGADAFASGSASTAGMTAGEALQTQVGRFANALPGGITPPPTGVDVPGLSSTGAAPVPTADVPDFMPKKIDITSTGNIEQQVTPSGGTVTQSGPAYDPSTATRAADYGYKPSNAASGPAGAYKTPTIGESFSKMGEGIGLGEGPASFDTFKQGASDLFSPGPTNAQVTARAQEIMSSTPGVSLKDAMAAASKELSPGILRTYGPAAVAGLGAMSALGGFESKPVQGGAITNSLMKPVTQRIAEEGSQRQMYMQGLPGVQYDKFGAPIFGGSTRLPTYDVPDYNSGGFGLSSSGEQGIMDLPTVYNSPAGSIGLRRVLQPYNNADMYSNLVPRRAAEGGYIQNFAEGGVAETTDIFKRVLGRDPTSAEFAKWQDTFKDGMDVKKWTAFTEDPTIANEQKQYNVRIGAERDATLASQKANRDRIAQEKAMKKAGGSGQMYNNINAGISALAPETNPMDATDTGFGARNRQAKLDVLNHNYAPMLQGQKNAMNQQAGIAASGQLPTDLSEYSGQDKAGLYRGLARQGLTDAQIRAAAENRYGMQSDVDWKGLQDTVANPNLNTDRPRSAADTARANQFNTEMMAAAQRNNAAKGQAPDTTGGMYSNITGPQAGYTGPNLYAQALSLGIPSVGSTPESELFRKQEGYQALRGQGATDAQIRYAGETMFGVQPDAAWNTLRGGKPPGLNMGGIAGLGAGGYPRRTGQISGPGTEKSDSIPAMLSDGEFVMTAKAVRGAGKGSRRAGAKQMYKLMHQLEKNSERG
jgi:hypothetical protein